MYNRLLFTYHENIPATCRMEEKKTSLCFSSKKTSRNTSSFQQQDKHSILLSLATSSAKFISFSSQAIHFSIHNIVRVVIIPGCMIRSLAKWKFGSLNRNREKKKQQTCRLSNT